MRMFTVYPEGGEAEKSFAIKATYPEPERARKYGTLQVCRGWTADRVVEHFRRIGRAEAVAGFMRSFTEGSSLSVALNRQELMAWHHA